MPEEVKTKFSRKGLSVHPENWEGVAVGCEDKTQFKVQLPGIGKALGLIPKTP